MKLLRAETPRPGRAGALPARGAPRRRDRVAATSCRCWPRRVGGRYLVMPLYRAARSPPGCARGRSALDETADARGRSSARGLDALHAHGIVPPRREAVERPARRRRHRRARRLRLARAADSTRLTRDGQLLGTPLYLAPELIEGAEATPASDIYALGCVLYECLAGGPPFTGRSSAELGFAHLVEPPPDPRERRPELPADVALALLTALEKEPGRRGRRLRLRWPGCCTSRARLRLA